MASPTNPHPSRAQLRRNLKDLRAILVDHPTNLDARMRVARTLRLLDRPRDAVPHYRAVARFLALAGQPLQAIAVLRELLQVDPAHEETLLFLAKLYARTRGMVASNVGRVAVPIDDGSLPQTLASGWPVTSTGIWRAIRPAEADDLVREMSPEEAGAIAVGKASREVTVEHQISDTDIVAVSDAAAADEEETAVEVPADDDFEVIGEPSPQELLLPTVPLLSSLSQRGFVKLAAAMTHRHAQAGAPLFTQDESGDSLMVISRGRVEAYRILGEERTLLETFGPGDFAGILSYLAPRGRVATLIAANDVEFFEIPKRVLDELVEENPPMLRNLHRVIRHRLLMTLLAHLPVVRGLPSKSRDAIVSRFVQRRFDAGELPVPEGAETNTLLLLLRGRMVIGSETEQGDVAREVEVVAPGDLIGCLAGLAEGAADAAVQATEPSVAMLIPHRQFMDLCVVYPDLARLHHGLDEERELVTEHIFRLSVGLRGDLIALEDDG